MRPMHCPGIRSPSPIRSPYYCREKHTFPARVPVSSYMLAAMLFISGHKQPPALCVNILPIPFMDTAYPGGAAGREMRIFSHVGGTIMSMPSAYSPTLSVNVLQRNILERVTRMARVHAGGTYHRLNGR